MTRLALAAAVSALCSASGMLALRGPNLSALDAAALAVAYIALVSLALGRARDRDRGSVASWRADRGFDDAAIGMLILSPQLVVLRANHALCALLDRRPEELLGRSILEFTHPEDVQRSVEQKAAMLDKPTTGQLIKRYLRPDGSVVDAVVTTAVRGAGCERLRRRRPYFFSQLQDVTDQRRAERQKAVIADLGHRALECSDVVGLMAEAVVQVRDTLEISSCLIGRRRASGEVRVVATTDDTLDRTVPQGQPTQTAFTLSGSGPVLSNDLLGETRFSVPAAILARASGRE